MQFSNAHLFQFVAWCGVVSLGVSLAQQSISFLLVAGFAFLTIPGVMRGVTYSTDKSWLVMMVLNSGVLFTFGLASKLMFRLDSPTIVQLFAATFLFWASVAAITPDAKKSPVRRHRVELLVPGLLGFASICLTPIVATPGGKISLALQLGCLTACGILTAIYVATLENVTTNAG